MARAAPRLIDRGDLLAALDRASARKVTIISAPAGSGKTSLLRAWADRPGQRHRLAVVQVHRDQHDAQDFWLAGELAEIRAADLRFTERETREVLAASGIALSGAGTALLHQRTEGWAAGQRPNAAGPEPEPPPHRLVRNI